MRLPRLRGISDSWLDPHLDRMNHRQVGLYLKLLCIAGEQRPYGTLPDDDQFLASALKISIERWQRDKGVVLLPFYAREDGRWGRKVMEEDWIDFQRYGHIRVRTDL